MADVVEQHGHARAVTQVPTPGMYVQTSGQRMHRNLAVSRRVLLHVVLIALALTMLFPFLWTVSASLKSDLDVISVPPTLLPNSIHWDNYSAVFRTLPMFRGLLNSVIVAVSGTALQLLTCSMAAYAFARIKFRFSNALFLVYLITLMVPVQVTMVPLFMLMRILGLVNSYPGLILPGITSAFGVFLLRQFFLTIPRDLEEAAFLDGASHWTVYSRIVMPLSKPGLAALSIFAFMSYWNAFLWPLLITTDNNMATLPLMTSLLQNQYTTYWNQLMAGSVISIIPIMVVYLFAQRHFVQGMTLSGLKG
jgi:multiple sugar transport system permease protein